jgi:hypothetical protein
MLSILVPGLTGPPAAHVSTITINAEPHDIKDAETTLPERTSAVENSPQSPSTGQSMQSITRKDRPKRYLGSGGLNRVTPANPRISKTHIGSREESDCDKNSHQVSFVYFFRSFPRLLPPPPGATID